MFGGIVYETFDGHGKHWHDESYRWLEGRTPKKPLFHSLSSNTEAAKTYWALLPLNTLRPGRWTA